MPQSASSARKSPGLIYKHLTSRSAHLAGPRLRFFKLRTRTKLQVPLEPKVTNAHPNTIPSNTDVDLKRLGTIRFSRTNKAVVKRAELRFCKVGINVSFKGKPLYGIKLPIGSEVIKAANGRFSSVGVRAYIPLATAEEIAASDNPKRLLAARCSAYQQSCQQESASIDPAKDVIFLRRNAAKFKCVAYPLAFIPSLVALALLMDDGIEYDCFGGGDDMIGDDMIGDGSTGGGASHDYLTTLGFHGRLDGLTPLQDSKSQKDEKKS